MKGDALSIHLKSCATTVCKAWSLARRDGVILGFTDHDEDIVFDGMTFGASSGLSARAIEQTTGLAVDNTEAVGLLSDPAISERDIRAGLWDGAEVKCWLVNWADPAVRRLVFKGSLGEIERGGGAFRAELRGLADALSRVNGRIYQRSCDAVLGDASCGVDISDPANSAEAVVVGVEGGVVLTLPLLPGHLDGWFNKGRIRILDGAGAGAIGLIKRDRTVGGQRIVDVWEYLSAGLAPGDRVKLEAGCDKSSETCASKFSNLLNFRGYPDIPGEDWLLAYPSSGGLNDGGSRRS